ncbi:radical SAM family heme chaperone HemW [bacterium]|jgi:oxygen-independent coproporphyrinogen III oxidase|nr:radical SAM family heme chaperone HemW [bacterium]MBT3903709.1 radical SAM family heme chaperone HemW [bacterium]MBT4577519.1 radical SAM family heme chaperone HemW [bacterium]MBT5345890.1 radical SAM family heme chaperone HemW [bacterium]MBT6131093.1 radical SAM family heme chaperone HemW [bacterium]
MQFDGTASPRSLYIHWPFCPYKCSFCPFVAWVGHDNSMTRYHRALCEEINRYADRVNRKLVIDTIYFGGGTPSTYPIHLLLDTFAILKNRFRLSPNVEITLEVNPGTVTEQKMKAWADVGVTRLSIGVQSLNDKVLANLNRKHTAHDTQVAIELAGRYFSNVSVDLIVGLPGSDWDDWKKIVNKIESWPVTHVSAYFLMVHEGTSLYFGVRRGRIDLPCDDTVVDMYQWGVERLKEFGFEQYEISSFAKEGCQSRHNKVYWKREPYQAFGLGACAFDGKVRYQNDKNLMNYMELIEQNKSVVAFHEVLTSEQVSLERIMLKLRQTKGILIDDLLKEIPAEKQDKLLRVLQQLQDKKLVELHDKILTLTPAGLALHNGIVTELSA